MSDYHALLLRIIRGALEEDIGPGDLTTIAVVPGELEGSATLVAKEELVWAGSHVLEMVYREVSGRVAVTLLFDEGSRVPEGSRVARITGPLAAILTGERTALNFVQRMSGIATETRKYAERAAPAGAKILDTRKTAPGLRLIDKHAVRVGGGVNHRFGLYDGILIKDNHIAAAGSVAEAVVRARNGAPHTLRVQVEVENFDAAQEALKAGADAILLDNMTEGEMQKVVQYIEGRIVTEASGGITLDRIERIARTGVDCISVGALTHSVKAADLSLEVL